MMKNRSWTKLDLLLLLLALAAAGNFLITAVELGAYSYDLDYSEGFLVENTQKFAETGQLYPEISQENNFRSVKYTPLVFIILSVVGNIFDFSFLYLRIPGIIAALGVVLMIHLLIKEKTGKRDFSTPLLFLAPYLTMIASLTIKPDIIALFFSLTGLYLFLKERTLMSSLMFLAAFLTKQIFLAGFLAVSLYLLHDSGILKDLIERSMGKSLRDFTADNRDFLVFNAFFGVAGLLILAVVQFLNPEFLNNVLFANTGAFSIRWDLIDWFHLTFLPLLSLGAVYCYSSRDTVLGAYAGLAYIFMMLQFTRGGASFYAGIEVYAVTLVCAGILYMETSRFRKYVATALILQAVLLMMSPVVTGSIFDVKDLEDKNFKVDQTIQDYVTETSGKVYVEYKGYELNAGKSDSPEIWGMYELYESGRLSEEDVNTFFREKNYTRILTFKRMRNLPISEYIEENYVLEDQVKRKDLPLNDEHWRVYRWTG